MKKLITLIALLAIAGTASAAIIADWDMTQEATANEQTLDADTKDANMITAHAGHSVVSDLRAATGGLKARDWDDSTTFDAAISYGQYFEITFEAASGYVLNLDSISMILEEGIGAADTIAYGVTASVLGHTSANALTTGQLTGAVAGDLDVLDLDLTGGAYDNLSSIEFRVYGWDDTTGAILTGADAIFLGNANTNDDGISDLQLTGDVALVPEPATVGMLGLGSRVALLIRRIRA